MLDAFEPLLATACKTIEADTKRKIRLAVLPVQQVWLAKTLNRFLLAKCKGDAATRVQSAEEDNGFEAWRLLCDNKLPKSATAAFNALMNPTFSSQDPRICLQQWDQECLRYTQFFGEQISETMKRKYMEISRFGSYAWNLSSGYFVRTLRSKSFICHPLFGIFV